MLALGMITTPRPALDVHNSIQQLRQGGFDEELHLFCEPQTPPVRPLPKVVVHRNSVQRGCVGNWAHCLRWLVEHTTAKYFLISEDDVSYCVGARAALEYALRDVQTFGYLSLYTPKHESQWLGDFTGWHRLDQARDIWGTQSMCFTRESASQLLNCKRLRADDQFRGSTDYIVMDCLQGFDCYYHRPSLVDHTGIASTIQHNWYADHVGFEFDPSFVPDATTTLEYSLASANEDFRFEVRPPTRAIVSVYQGNISQQVLSAQAEVIAKWLPVGCHFEQYAVSHHAFGLDEYFARGLHHDAYLILDIDCIPLEPWAIPWLFQNASAGTLVGCAQRANHLQNGNHLYAGPCGLAFSRETFLKLGRPSFRATDRADVAEEITFAAEDQGVPITFLWPTEVQQPKWNLIPGVDFGLGTTYGGILYHAFEISKGTTLRQFLDKTGQVLGAELAQNEQNEGVHRSSPLVIPWRSPQAIFHEDWYPPEELELLTSLMDNVQKVSGVYVEIGCWEGRSTIAIADRCWPEKLYAVDLWRGNLSEDAEHETVRLLRMRDVYRVFRHNVATLARGNVIVCREDSTQFLNSFELPICFCHLDAGHDYGYMRSTLELVLPRLVRGGVLIGHDYQTAHAGRMDLDGGVERAVKEMLHQHEVHGNMWWHHKS